MSLPSDFALADKVADRSLTVMERQITNKYKQSYKTVKSVFADVFAKYEQGGVLTYEEMAKYNRLQAMQKEINKTLTEMYQADRTLMNSGLKGIYADGYYRTAYALESDIQARLSYKILDAARIKAAVQNPISGLTLNETLAKNRVNVISKINQEITRGLVKGQSYGKMANAIKDVLGGDAKKAIRVAQTEAHRVHNMARYESIKHADDIGVDMVKVWVATLDGSTRPAHQTLDGKEVKPKADFHSSNGGSGPAPGMMGTAADDINCRCTMIAQVAGVKSDFRRVRGEGVVPYKTYDEWAKAKGIKP